MPVDGSALSIVGQIGKRALNSPDSAAVADDTESVSYAELWRRAEAVARLLRALGSRPGRPVGLCVSPTVLRVASMLGTMGLGSPYVPIDPNFPDSRIRSIIDSAGVECVIVDERTTKRFAAMPYRLLDVSAVSAGSSSDPVGQAMIEPAGSDLAYIIYTSGTTGNPKGVAIEHRGISNLLRALDEVLPPPRHQVAECWLAATNVCFDISVVELFWPLSRGIPLVVAELESLAGKPGDGAEFLTEMLCSGRVTHFQATPSLVQLMLQDPALAAALRGLHVLIMGGEVVRPELVARLRPVPHIYNGYGPTEATVYTTMHECTDADVEHVPIGRALRGVDLRVVDEAGRDCPPGAVGELLIAGAGLARGYVNDAELTARKFPVLGDGAGARRWYRTGDLVSIDADSVVRYRGRIDSQVKVRGFRVELGEIEAAIRAVPGVDEAAVFPVRDRGGAVIGLTAAAKSARTDLSEKDILAEIGQVLPWYAVPGTVRILPEMPISVSGKLDRKTLERRLAEFAPVSRDRPANGHPDRLPAGDLERIVAEIWGEVLGVGPDIDANARFFDLGGNSALLGSVFARLLQAFPEAHLQLVDLYRYPTISQLAAYLGAGTPYARRQGAPSLPSAAGSGAARPARLSAADRRRLARRSR